MNADTQIAPQIIQDATGQHYGALLTFDARDHALAAYTTINAATQPISYFPNLEGIPYWDQNKLGSCVGHAAGKARQVMSFHEDGAATVTPYSARFLYAYAKCIDGNPTIQGTDPRVVAKILKSVGCATEATCQNNTLLDHSTYTYGGLLSAIPAAAITEANAGRKISNYAFADVSEAGLKAAIQFAGEHQGGVFMLTNIDKNWWTDINGNTTWAAAGLFPLRPPTDAATLGGHETMPYAFDVKNGRTIIWDFNSWSNAWGSTTGYGTDGGSAWFYLDEWLPHIKQIVVVFDIPMNYAALGFSYNFTKALSQGMGGSDVVALQHLLRIDGEFPEGVPFTGYFGPTTRAAVCAFQAKYASEILTPVGLAQPTGFVGVSTLKKLNGLSNSKA